MQQQYEFQFRRSRIALVFELAGAFAAFMGAAFMILLTVRGGSLPAMLISVAVVLVVIGAVCARRALTQVHVMKIGRAGVYFESLRTKRFLPWVHVVGLEGVGAHLEVVFRRDEASVRRVWIPCADARLQTRVARVSEQHRAEAARRPAVTPTRSGRVAAVMA